MAEHGVRGTERQTKRLEAFSDAVLAIAITLPIVEIQLPNVGNGSHLLPALAGLWREYLAYGMSVVAIGLYWAKAHFSGKLLEKTDHGYNLLSLLFLAAVSVLPLPTRALALHIGGDDNSREATLLYVVFLTIASILWSMQWFYAVYAKLLDPRLERAYLRRVSQLHIAFVASYTIALGFTLIDWRLGLCAAGLVMCLFGIRPLRPQYKPGEEPETDIQEADERPRGSAAG